MLDAGLWIKTKIQISNKIPGSIVNDLNKMVFPDVIANEVKQSHGIASSLNLLAMTTLFSHLL
jgi:hypothetical protein